MKKIKYLIFIFLGYALGSLALTTGKIALTFKENIALSNIIPGEEGQILKSIDGEATWVDDYLITSSMTLNIPSEYADLNEVMIFLADKRIAANRYITIKLADGSYNYSAPIDLSHIDGRQIIIEGNTANPENVVIDYSVAGGNGFVLDKTYFGTIKGLTIIGRTNSGYGIYLSSDSHIKLENIHIENFKYNLRAENKSSIIADDLSLRLSTLYAARISNQSFLSISNSLIYDHVDRGLLAIRGSLITSDNSNYYNNGGSNFYIGSKSFINSDTDSHSGTTSNITANATNSNHSYLYQY